MKNVMNFQLMLVMAAGIAIGGLAFGRSWTSPSALAAEQRGSAAPANFQFRTVSTYGGERVIVRFNPRTGEAWSNNTVNAPEWTKIPDDGPLPDGDYEIFLERCREVKDGVFGVRVDMRTGKAWNWGDKWTLFKESAK